MQQTRQTSFTFFYCPFYRTINVSLLPFTQFYSQFWTRDLRKISWPTQGACDSNLSSPPPSVEILKDEVILDVEATAKSNLKFRFFKMYQPQISEAVIAFTVAALVEERLEGFPPLITSNATEKKNYWQQGHPCTLKKQIVVTWLKIQPLHRLSSEPASIPHLHNQSLPCDSKQEFLGFQSWEYRLGSLMNCKAFNKTMKFKKTNFDIMAYY